MKGRGGPLGPRRGDRKSFPYEATVIAGKLLMPADLQRLPPVLAGFKDGESHLG